jgi:pyochelin biosynthesis protein PchC
MTGSRLSPSILRVSERPGTSPVLIAFPHAGAGASAYHQMASVLESAETWAVQLPGRESRLAEPVCTDMPTLAASLSEELAPLLDRPFGVYGHSLGAVIGFEVCLNLAKSGLAPEFFLPAASRAPGAWRLPPGMPENLEGSALVDFARKGGTPEEVLANEEFREIVFRSLRADLKLGSTYLADPAGHLSCPVTAFYGLSDPAIRADAMRHWADATTGPFGIRAIQGSHLFLLESADALGLAVRDVISHQGLAAK